MLGVTRAEELARICAAVGLVQNLGALKALATVGIVKGHMQLHAANLAIAAGADLHEIARSVNGSPKFCASKSTSTSHARKKFYTPSGFLKPPMPKVQTKQLSVPAKHFY